MNFKVVAIINMPDDVVRQKLGTMDPHAASQQMTRMANELMAEKLRANPSADINSVSILVTPA